MSSAGWMNEIFQEISSLSLSVLAYGAAEVVGGNGFIAAFVAARRPVFCASAKDTQLSKPWHSAD